MGNTYTVDAWGQHRVFGPDDLEYSNMMQWQGESFWRALWELRKAKKRGFGCVSLSWR